MLKTFAVLVLLFGSSLSWAQDRFESGDLAGFTKSPTEGIIVRLDQPFVLHRVGGLILRSAGDQSPLEGVLFELRGPGESTTIRSATTGLDGKFQLAHVPWGKYAFKATASGFQSIVGVVILTSKAAPTRRIKLSMRPGV